MYDAEKHTLTYNNNLTPCYMPTPPAPFEPIDGKIKIELLVDRTSIEIFGNDGRIYIPRGVLPAESKESVAIIKDGEIKINKVEVFELNSIEYGQGLFVLEGPW